MPTDISVTLGRVALQAFQAEALRKGLPSSEDELFQLVNNTLAIIEEIPTSSAGDVQSSFSNQDAMALMEIRTHLHTLRVLAWTGNPNKLAMIRASCVELGKINYSMSEEDCRNVNDKMKQALGRTMQSITDSISHLKIERGVLKTTHENLNFTMKPRSRSTSWNGKRRLSKKPVPDQEELAPVPILAQNICDGSATVGQIMAEHNPSPSPSPNA